MAGRRRNEGSADAFAYRQDDEGSDIYGEARGYHNMYSTGVEDGNPFRAGAEESRRAAVVRWGDAGRGDDDDDDDGDSLAGVDELPTTTDAVANVDDAAAPASFSYSVAKHVRVVYRLFMVFGAITVCILWPTVYPSLLTLPILL